MVVVVRLQGLRKYREFTVHKMAAACILLDVLPRELMGQVMRHLEHKELIRLSATRRDVAGILEGCLRGWLSELCEELRAGLLVDRCGDGDKIDVQIRETYMGGGQPVDGDLVSISPLLFSWEMRASWGAGELESMWAGLKDGLRAADFPGMAFAHASVSWEFEVEELVLIDQWPFIVLPKAVQDKLDAFTKGLNGILRCMTLLRS